MPNHKHRKSTEDQEQKRLIAVATERLSHFRVPMKHTPSRGARKLKV